MICSGRITRRLKVHPILGAALIVWVVAHSLVADELTGVVVVASRVPTAVRLEFVPSRGEPWKGNLNPGAVQTFSWPGLSDIEIVAGKQVVRHKASRDQAYVVVAGREPQTVELQQLAFGEQPIEEGSPPLNVRVPEEQLARGVLPVRVLFDAREPETQRAWERRLRRRLEIASEILEPATGMRLEVVGAGSWTPGEQAGSWASALKDFEERVPLETARLAIGFTRHYPVSPDEFARSGTLRAPLGSHILVPETNVGITSDQCLDMLLHELGHFWGAVHVPEPNSPMRLTLAQAPRPWPLAYDPANALVMRMVADEVRGRGVNSLMELSVRRRQHLDAIHAKLAAALSLPPPERLGDRPLAADLPKKPPAGAPQANGPGAMRGNVESLEPLPPDKHLVVKEIPVPDIPGGYAIWTGGRRDRSGHVWFAMSSEGIAHPSAHLFEWDPERRQARDRGDVAANLRSAGKLREGELCGLICSSIVTAKDGYVYFASIGEDRSVPEGSRRPPWGSHLWRVRQTDGAWEHLASVPEGVIAVARHEDWLYALAYPGHLLFQYQLRTGQLRKIEIGSAGGHVCRSLVVDSRGHVFVPRVGEGAIAGEKNSVELVELNDELEPLNGTPLEHYAAGAIGSSPGIVANFEPGDGSVMFVTAAGAIYRIKERLSVTESAPLECLARPGAQGNLPVRSGAVSADGRRVVMTGLSAAADRTVVALLVADLEQRKVAWQPLAQADGLAELQVLGASVSDAGREFWLAGTYRRGPLAVTPSVVEVLRARGFSEEQLSRLADNARRSSQPILFSVQFPP